MGGRKSGPRFGLPLAGLLGIFGIYKKDGLKAHQLVEPTVRSLDSYETIAIDDIAYLSF